MSIDLSDVRWCASSYSTSGNECVEVAHLDEDLVGVRDSKNPAGPALLFAPAEWDAFTAGIADGQFDR
ncbi:DUF397 domain-containing protein [Nocardia alni]|uniref:DUF397 domain-containing protein n=1 Tax=Nocardia alni TaxID=2815723 RepID=UPI001C2280E9|nr:DUF397 domain-containing protein [Nocardia alni]